MREPRPTNWPALLWSSGALAMAIGAVVWDLPSAGLAAVALAIVAAALIVHDGLTTNRP